MGNGKTGCPVLSVLFFEVKFGERSMSETLFNPGSKKSGVSCRWDLPFFHAGTGTTCRNLAGSFPSVRAVRRGFRCVIASALCTACPEQGRWPLAGCMHVAGKREPPKQSPVACSNHGGPTSWGLAGDGFASTANVFRKRLRDARFKGRFSLSSRLAMTGLVVSPVVAVGSEGFRRGGRCPCSGFACGGR